MACVGRMIVGVFAALLLGLAQPASAQPGRANPGALRVDAFDVEQVASLAPGTQLNFSVFATPGAAATVLIDGVRRLVELREVEPGVYEGSHTIAVGDRLRLESSAVATVWRDGAVARASLEESLVLDGTPPPPAATSRGAVTEVEPLPRDLPSPVPAPPPGRYGTAVPAPVGFAPAPPIRSQACSDCAYVESIRSIESPNGPAVVGAIAGGIAGALFGDTIGKAHEKHVTRLLGAVGGALLGHEIERAATRRTQYEATLRLPDGGQRVRRYDSPPPFRAGETIHLEAAGSTESARRF